jgi:formiminoglutamase
MELSIFFDPIRDEVVINNNEQNLHYYLNISDTYKPDWQNAHIVIIGLTEFTGSSANSERITKNGVDNIRQEFYKLFKSNSSFKICDLGNLRNGIDLQETYHKIKVVTEILLEKNIIPLFVGGSHDLDWGIYSAYQEKERLVSLLNIDAVVDMETDSAKSANKSHIHKILVHEPNFLLNYAHLAYQSFHNHSERIKTLEKLNFDLVRLGSIRDDFRQVEPLFREADFVSIDINAVRVNDSPANCNANPFGLTAEEICQMAWYAGSTEKLSSFGIFEYHPELDSQNRTAKIIAVMMWYFIEGFYSRKKENDFDSDDFLKYIVDINKEPHNLVFLKSKKTDRWWMEVPVRTSKIKVKNIYLPCNYSDYKNTLEGEIPLRWITAHARVS